MGKPGGPYGSGGDIIGIRDKASPLVLRCETRGKIRHFVLEEHLKPVADGNGRGNQPQQRLDVAPELHAWLIRQLKLSNHLSVLDEQAKLLLAHVSSQTVLCVDADINQVTELVRAAAHNRWLRAETLVRRANPVVRRVGVKKRAAKMVLHNLLVVGGILPVIGVSFLLRCELGGGASCEEQHCGE